MAELLLLRRLHRIGRRGRAGLGRRHGLTLRPADGLQRRTDDDAPALGARYRTANEDQIALAVDLDDAQILGRTAYHAHVARHALAFEHAARSLALTNRAGAAMRHRIAMAGHAAGE